ncbi:MAG: archease [Candidatus Diapherotrites archaeon]|nr:archease [Candidatus Diapherotrites archaeon]
MSFELFEHTADIGLRGKGKTLEEAFSECGNALLEVMSFRNKTDEKKSIEVNCSAESKENLLVNYLNELLYIMDSKDYLFKRIEVKSILEKEAKFFLKAECFGEKLDFSKHELKTEVKAATYSGLKIQKKNNEFIAECIADV